MTSKIQTRTHRERAQPSARIKFGLLEKHKDYKERARSFAEKQDRLQVLQRAAQQRNPDEFYFGMISSRIVETGIHRSKGSTKPKNTEGGVLDNDVAIMMKTQDSVYLEMVRQMNRSKLSKLEENEIDTKTMSRQHIRFAQDHSEAIQKLKDTKKKNDRYEGCALICNDHEKSQEIEVRRKRVKKLTLAIQALHTQRQAMGKGKKEKIGSDDQGFPVYKWAHERKR